jgi:chromodomain-helicase-DNA-binding protein 1
MEIEYGMPEANGHPIIFVAHYNVFSKRKPKKKKTAEDIADEEDVAQDNILEELFAEILEADKKAKSKKIDVLKELQKIHWDIVILDEAHRIKGRNTGWTREIKRLKTKIRHVMTGTGFINNPAEIWSLLHFLNKQEFTSYWRFREAYCNEALDYASGQRVILGINPAKRDEFRQLVRTIGPRRTKTEVFPNLPSPIYSPVGVELNSVQRKMYDDIVMFLQTLDQQETPLVVPNILAALQRTRQVAVATPKVVREWYDPVEGRTRQEIELVEPSSKLDAMMEIIEGLEWDEERRDQVVVFSNFKDPIKLAIERFKKKGISYIELKQSDNDRTRYEKWAIEFPKREHQVFICTLQLGSESISLTSATTCIFLDRSWSPKDNDQGESRVWRPGQESVANIIHINAKDTVDSRVFDVNQIKKGWFKEIFSEYSDA